MNINSLKFTFLFLLVLSLLMVGKSGWSQISPGDLSKAHSDLEGMGNCVKCHELGKSVLNEKCLECHTEMNQLIKQNKGYHVSFEVKKKKCFECHNEHHGRNFSIIKFDKDKFDHQLAGYELKGKHQKIECQECHKAEYISVKLSQKKEGDTYIGLVTECLACHKDYHQSSLGSDCTKCHFFKSFKPTEGFNHQQTDFPLFGKHASTDCVKCHKKENRDSVIFQQFKGVKADNCTDCHTDVHEGKFGSDCLKCHNQESFRSIDNIDQFDHNTTNFPLEGMHQSVDCKSCHKTNYTAKVKHDLCTDCHVDYHNGQFQ